jgi:hypothetical protein
MSLGTLRPDILFLLGDPKCGSKRGEMIGMGGHGHRMLALALVVLLARMGALSAYSASSHSQVKARACNSQVLHGVLPVWARKGFSNPKPRMPHVLGAAGKITAILWADPLLSPQPKSHNNKILWVARVTTNIYSNLRISAQRMIGSTKVGSPVTHKLIGGPGPSIIDMPAAGCWRFTLHWSSERDTLDLRYASNR